MDVGKPNIHTHNRGGMLSLFSFWNSNKRDNLVEEYILWFGSTSQRQG